MVLRGPARKGGGDCFYGRRLTGSARVRTTLLAPSVVAIKAGYKAVKGVKPGFIKHAVGELLPDFAKALDPVYNDAKSANKPVAEYFVANSDRVADALLTITDERAKNAKSGLVKGTYEKLRGTAKKNVEAAVPRLGKMVERFSS